MPEHRSKIDRRQLLTQAAAIGAAVTAGAPSTAKAAAPARGELPTRVLGKTGLTLPILGFGGAALPAMWGNPLSRENRVELVRYAFDRGVRYFDTAGASYMESQAILGEALKDRRRHVCLVTKVDTTAPAGVRPSVERSLQELQTDHLDILLIHGTPGIEQMTVAEAMKIHAEIAKLRDEKVVRHIGFSAHSYFDKGLELIATGAFEMCMLSYGYLPRGYNQFWSARMTELRNACVARAEEAGMGIVAMKVVGAGMLGAWANYIVPGYDKQRVAGLPAASIRFALQDKRLDLLNIGMRLKEEIDSNIRTLTGDPTYTPADRALLSEFAVKLYESSAVKQMRVD